MSDLISRQQALEAFRKELCAEETGDREYAISYKGVEDIINRLPAVNDLQTVTIQNFGEADRYYTA